MSYIDKFVSNEIVSRFVQKSFISIVQDDAEVVFYPYINNLIIKNYYIGSPLDGYDPSIEVIYESLVFRFYLSENRDLNRLDEILNDLEVIVQAFCDSQSKYKVYTAEFGPVMRMAIVNTETGKVVVSTVNQGAGFISRIRLLSKPLKKVDS